jgi:NTE family protein
MNDGNGREADPGSRRPRVGLALASGGPEGAIYEIGVLRALDEALDGLDFNDLDIYVGVSAGAFVGANLVNGLNTGQMCRALVSDEPGEHPFVPETFFTPAWSEYLKGARALPKLLWEALRDYLRTRDDKTLREALMRLSRALPVGLFDNEPIRRYLEKIYNLKGRSDDFRRLHKRLVIVAADLDSGESVRFGEPGHDHVPISRAVQASSALPGLYSPVEVDGRHVCDGVLLKTLHASVALEAGAELVLCINPIVPVNTAKAVEQGLMDSHTLLDRGLVSVLSQTLRTVIHSRLEVGMASYQWKFLGANVVLIQPQRDDYLMFFTNIFGLSERQAVCEYAYKATRRDLLARYDELAPIFARHGVTLRKDILEEPRSLWEEVFRGRPGHAPRAVAGKSGTRPAGKGSGREVLTRLDGALSRLDRLIEARWSGSVAPGLERRDPG